MHNLKLGLLNLFHLKQLFLIIEDKIIFNEELNLKINACTIIAHKKHWTKVFSQGFCGFCALALIHSLTCLPDISFASFINKEMNKPRAGFTVVFHYSLNAIAPIFCMGPEFK